MRLAIVAQAVFILCLGLSGTFSQPAGAADAILQKRPDIDPVMREKAQALADQRTRVLQQKFSNGKTAEELSLEMAETGKRHALKASGAERPQEQQRKGLYLLLSFSLPDPVLREYIHDAHRLHLRIVFRGWVERSFKKTRARLMQLADRGDGQPDPEYITASSIDPVLFRRAGIHEVPALVQVQDDRYRVVIGGGSVGHMLETLARQDAAVRPLAEWALNPEPTWHAGAQPIRPRPPLPPVVQTTQVRTEFASSPILEEDLIAVFQEKVAQADWKSVQEHGKQAIQRKLVSGPGLHLPRATRHEKRLIDLTTEFPQDIRDPKSNAILVKGGSRVNPLRELRWIYTALVVDVSDPAQVAWARRYLKQHDPNTVKIMATDGSVKDAMDQLQHRVYWLPKALADQWQITGLPARVAQVSTRLEVEQYVLR